MFNVTGGELVIIFLVALIILGPERLPGAARTVGRVMAQIREVSNSFQKELSSAMEDVKEPIDGFGRPQLKAIEGGAQTPDPTALPVDPEPVPGWSTPPRPVLPGTPSAPLPADIAAAAPPVEIVPGLDPGHGSEEGGPPASAGDGRA